MNNTDSIFGDKPMTRRHKTVVSAAALVVLVGGILALMAMNIVSNLNNDGQSHIRQANVQSNKPDYFVIDPGDDFLTPEELEKVKSGEYQLTIEHWAGAYESGYVPYLKDSRGNVVRKIGSVEPIYFGGW